MHGGSHHMALFELFTMFFFLYNLTFIGPNYRLLCWRRVWLKDKGSKWKIRKEWMASIKFGWNVYCSLCTFQIINIRSI